MGTSISKSRTFAIIQKKGAVLHITFLAKKTNIAQNTSELVITRQGPKWQEQSKNNLIELLVAGGLTVRYFDPEESQWMDLSQLYGLVRVKGNRDGTWGEPDLELFEEEYLKAM